MSYTTSAIYGTGFVLYDTYDETNETHSRNTDTFIQKFMSFAKTSDIYKHIDWNYPELSITDLLCEEPLEYNVDLYIEDEEVSSHFTPLDGKPIKTTEMIVVYSDKEPSMYQAPYNTKEEFIQSIKDILDKIGFTQCLPDDFDYEAHIGTFDTCVHG